MGFRSWEERRERMDDAIGDLEGSKPIKSIRAEIKRTIKDTHSFMKDIHELDARETVPADDREQFRQRADTLAARYRALSNSLASASISSTASVKDRTAWADTRKRVMTQLSGASLMLEDTATSLEKMRIEK